MAEDVGQAGMMLCDAEWRWWALVKRWWALRARLVLHILTYQTARTTTKWRAKTASQAMWMASEMGKDGREDGSRGYRKGLPQGSACAAVVASLGGCAAAAAPAVASCSTGSEWCDSSGVQLAAGYRAPAAQLLLPLLLPLPWQYR